MIKMTIISVSISESLLKQLDERIKKSGYSGRSDIIRAALREFLSRDIHEELKKRRKETLHATLTVSMPETAKETLHETEHGLKTEVVKTHIHQCLPDHKCMEIFVLEGTGRNIERFLKRIEALPKVETVNLVIGD